MSAHGSISIPVQQITRAILSVRGRRIILDSDLATLYGVTTKRLNEQVKRNLNRFPEDFLFQLARTEVEALNRSHFATGSQCVQLASTDAPSQRPQSSSARGR